MPIRCKLEEVELNVEIDYTPAQNGGRTEPSWEAHFSLETIRTLNGDEISSILSDEQRSAITQQVQDHLDAEATEAEESKYPKED